MRHLDDVRKLAEHAISGSIGLVAAIALNELAVDGAFAWAFVGLWAGLAIAALLLGQRDPIGRRDYLLTALTAILAAGIAAVTLVAPPSRLFVTSDGLAPWVALQTIGSIGLLVGALAVLGRADGPPRGRRGAWIAAGVVAALPALGCSRRPRGEPGRARPCPRRAQDPGSGRAERDMGGRPASSGSSAACDGAARSSARVDWPCSPWQRPRCSCLTSRPSRLPTASSRSWRSGCCCWRVPGCGSDCSPIAWLSPSTHRSDQGRLCTGASGSAHSG